MATTDCFSAERLNDGRGVAGKGNDGSRGTMEFKEEEEEVAGEEEVRDSGRRGTRLLGLMHVRLLLLNLSLLGLVRALFWH